jgi:hypothetical protein
MRVMDCLYPEETMTHDHQKLLELEAKVDVLLLDVASGLPLDAYRHRIASLIESFHGLSSLVYSPESDLSIGLYVTLLVLRSHINSLKAGPKL